MQINTNNTTKMEHFLEDLEGLLKQYYGDAWSYEFDFDKPITIHVPVEE